MASATQQLMRTSTATMRALLDTTTVATDRSGAGSAYRANHPAGATLAICETTVTPWHSFNHTVFLNDTVITMKRRREPT